MHELLSSRCSSLRVNGVKSPDLRLSVEDTQGYIFIFLPKPSYLNYQAPRCQSKITPVQSIVNIFYFPCIGCGMTESLLTEPAKSSTLDIVTTAVTSILIALCIIGNSLVCAVVRKNHDMRSVHNNTWQNLK